MRPDMFALRAASVCGSSDKIQSFRFTAQGSLRWYEGVKRRVQTWSWAFFLVSLTASLLWVFKVPTFPPKQSGLDRIWVWSGSDYISGPVSAGSA